MISILLAVKAEISANGFLPSAIGTVLGQMYSDWELLIGVNGKDEAGTFKEANKWNSIDGRIRVYFMRNASNRGTAMNELLALSQGALVAAIDVDDLWHPMKLEKQIPFTGRYSVVGTLGCYFGSRYQDIGVPAGPIGKTCFSTANPILHSAVLMQRSYAKWVESDDPRVPTDYVRWMDMAIQGESFYNVPEMLTFIRLHDDRWSDKNDNRNLIAKMQEEYDNKLK